MSVLPENLESGFLLGVLAEVSRGAPLVISVYDLEARFTMQIGRGLESLGLQPNQLVGVSLRDAFAGASDAIARVEAALRGEASSNTQDLGNTIWDNWFSPLRDAAGRIIGAVSISTDVTERERTRVELEQRLAVIESQSAAIREMSVPIIRVWEDVLVVPIVGELNTDRAADIMERLLTALTQARARHAILDVTGVDAIDTRTADQFVQIINAVGLLGVRGIISGIRPAVAHSLVAIGVDLGRVVTVATLHDALRRCMLAGVRKAGPEGQAAKDMS